MKEAFICIQCPTPNGERGTYLRNKHKEIISPVFQDFYYLYKWMKENSWEFSEYVDNKFSPGRVINNVSTSSNMKEY